MEDWEIYPRQAVATAVKAMDQGIARMRLSSQEVYDHAATIIKRSQDTVKLLMRQGIIKAPPPTL